MATSAPLATLVVAYSINVDASTGDHVGYGTLVGPSDMVVLHTKTGERVLSQATHQLTLRLQVADDTGNVQVVDGIVHAAVTKGRIGLPPAVIPQTAVKAQAAQTFWRPPDAAGQLARVLAENEQNEPESPPFHTPEPPGIDGPPGIHGPWCIPFPSCPGCH